MQDISRRTKRASATDQGEDERSCREGGETFGMMSVSGHANGETTREHPTERRGWRDALGTRYVPRGAGLPNCLNCGGAAAGR